MLGSVAEMNTKRGTPAALAASIAAMLAVPLNCEQGLVSGTCGEGSNKERT
jgi:hypothetical protein